MRRAVQARRFELIAWHPIHGALRQHRLPAQREAEFGNRSVTGEVHVGRKFVAGPMVALRRVFFVLCFAPFRWMAGKLHPGIDGERRHAGARHAEMIGPIVVAGARLGIRLNLESKEGSRSLDGGVERGSLGARDVDGLRHAYG